MESTCQRGTILLPLLSLCLFFVGGLVVAHADHGEDYYATCKFEPLGFQGINISGTIKLYESGSLHTTTLVGHLYGFEKGNTSYRGFHVHEFGSIGGNCTAAGLHFNPLNKTHGAPNDTERHLGDLGNIFVESNLESMVNISDSMISLHGQYSIANLSLVVHAWVDDLGRGGHVDSNKTGNSGYRIGCCIITLDQVTTTPSASTTPAQSATVTVGPLIGVLLVCLAGLQLLMSSIQL